MLSISNKKITALLIIALALTLSANVYTINKYNDEVVVKEDNETQLDDLKAQVKDWKDKKKRLQFIKANFPDKDVENTLLGFSNEINRLSKEVGIDLNDIEVNMETLRTKDKLVFVEINVKVNGSSSALSYFMNLSRQDKFTHIREVNTKYNREKDINEILVKYELIAHTSNKVSKISNPDDLINNDTIYRNIMGEWVDFFTYKKQIKELEKYGHIRQNNDDNKVKESIYTGESTSINTNAQGGQTIPIIEVEGFEVDNNKKDEVMPPTTPTVPTNTKAIDKIKFTTPTDKLNIIKNFSSDYMGIDIGVKAGTKVRAVAEGKVIFTGDMDEYGNTVIIDHGSNIKSLYGNLSEISIKNNEQIKRGATIGLSGKTENLEYYHFRLSDGEFIDPTKYIEED